MSIPPSNMQTTTRQTRPSCCLLIEEAVIFPVPRRRALAVFLVLPRAMPLLLSFLPLLPNGLSTFRRHFQFALETSGIWSGTLSSSTHQQFCVHPPPAFRMLSLCLLSDDIHHAMHLCDVCKLVVFLPSFQHHASEEKPPAPGRPRTTPPG